MRRLIAITFILATASAGCSKHKPTVDELTKIKTAACACTDKACAEKYDKQMESLFDGLDEKDLDEKTIGIAMDIAMCLAKQGVR